MKIIWVMLVLIFSSSCHKSKDENLLNGEWKYVRSFKIYQSFHCYECPGFDYDSAIYHFLLKNNHEFTGRINRIECGGTVHIESEEKGKEVSSGDFHITEFTIYNKPIVTKEDTDFIDLFERDTQYYRIHHADTDVYRFLELYSGEDILLFAQKN